MFQQHIALTASLFLAGLCCLASPASAERLSSSQFQFMEAARKGEIQKARDIMELAKLDPNDFNGQPFVKWMFFDGGGQLNAMTDAAFDYVFKELKQPFNIPAGSNGSYPVFAFFCINMGAGTYSQLENVAGLQRTQARINWALANGANAKHIKTGWEHWRRQPLPRCVEEYFSWRHNPQARSIMLAIMDTMIKAGADPNYDRPLEKAAEKFDVQLFQMLVDNGARADHAFPVSHEADSSCGKHGLPPNTIIAKLPTPTDKDIPLAKTFLEALQEAGIDIMEKQNFVRFWAGRCERQQLTLVDRAVAFGNTGYAKMVMGLAKARPASASPEATSASAPLTTGSLPGGSRIVTSSFNVREQPALDGALLSMLGPNTVFEVEETSPDGQWTRINAVPIVRGWANTAVILRSSTPNTTGSP
jgi:hypothetical protein